MARFVAIFLHLACYQVLFVGFQYGTDDHRRRLSSSIAAAEANLNPYDVLGVRRTASLKEIKRVYKSLAREWHPDKNDDPEAQQKFIEISQAYEILSDEDKRRQFDDHGHVNDNQHPLRHQNHGFGSFNFGGFSFKFDNSGGGGGRRGSQSQNSQRITYPMLHDTILPESHKKAYMVLVTGQMCFSCLRVEEVWENNAQELKNAGIGIGTVYGDFDRRLVRDLGVHSWPSIVGVINERIYYFGSQRVSTENLRAFAMGLFQPTHIETINDDNFKGFLAGHTDNLPRTLLFSRKAAPSLLYLTTAYEFRDKMAFGFASLKSRVHIMRKQYGVDSTCLLLFKEDADNYAASLETSMLQRESMREIIIDNQYLYAPRLTSQQVFDDLCPVSPSKKTRKVCVILFTQRGRHNEHRRAFSQVAVDTSFFPVGSTFMYVYAGSQTAFTRSMGAEFTQDLTLPVAIAWRRTKNKLNFDWLPGGWRSNDEEDNQRRLGDYLLELSRFNVNLSQNKQIETLSDENEPHWVTSWMKFMWSSFQSLLRSSVQYVLSSRWDEVTLVICVLIAYVVAMVVLMTGYIGPRNKSTNGEAEMNEPPRKQHISVYSLNPESYETLILRAPPGKMTLLILVDQTNRKDLFVQAQNAIKYQIDRMQGWQFSFLQVDQYSFWYEQLTNQQPGTLDASKIIGNILAINGHRKYYCLYNAWTQIAAYRASHQNSQMNPESVGFGDSDSDSDEDDTIPMNNLYAPLSMWIDRLYDGSTQRISVDEWPTFDT